MFFSGVEDKLIRDSAIIRGKKIQRVFGIEVPRWVFTTGNADLFVHRDPDDGRSCASLCSACRRMHNRNRRTRNAAVVRNSIAREKRRCSSG